ncbi:MAG: RNA methyltransferase [Acidobacteria bacterium]|nr:RNA methyltransferase [Acidobacteriota bacterium]
MKAITSRQNPLVQRCRELARRRPADGDGILLEGAHLIADALQARVPVSSALMSASALQTAEGAAMASRLAAAGADVYGVTEAVIESASPVRTPSGVVAIAHWRLSAVEGLYLGASPLVVAVEALQDPGNLGAIIRAADAAGATGVIVTQGSADPLGWKALRGSMGSAFRIPVAIARDASTVCQSARRHGLRTIATSPASGTDLFDVNLRGPLLVLLGGEGAGLSEEVLAAADERLRIPMRPPIESLNVSVATGIILFEAVRQRRAGAAS